MSKTIIGVAFRCIACNVVLTQSEQKALKPGTAEPEDLCRKCLRSIYIPEEETAGYDAIDVSPNCGDEDE
jgi:hypothetical protein